jgi:hypothetical protein
MVDWIEEIFELASLPGHLSYIILAVSYLLTSIVWLRVTAIIAMLLEIVYFWLAGASMAAGIAWDLVFVAINLVMLGLLVKDWGSARMNRADRHAMQRLLTGLDGAQISRIVRRGRWSEWSDGDVIVTIDEPVGDIHVVMDGLAIAMLPFGRRREVGPGALIGEMSFATGHASIATVVAAGTMRCFTIAQDDLQALMARDQGIASVVYRLIGEEIGNKMRLDYLAQAVDDHRQRGGEPRRKAA